MPKNKKDDSKLLAFFATFLSIVGFALVIISKKNDKYVTFYAKQSLVIFIIYIIGFAVSMLPLMGKIISPFIYIATIVFWVFSWVYALSGETKKVPFVGDYAQKIKL